MNIFRPSELEPSPMYQILNLQLILYNEYAMFTMTANSWRTYEVGSNVYNDCKQLENI